MQRLISVLKQHSDEIGLSKCVLKVTTIDKRLSTAVSLLPHDATVSPFCAKFSGWIHSNMTPQNNRCFGMRFSRKNGLAKIRRPLSFTSKPSLGRSTSLRATMAGQSKLKLRRWCILA